MTLAEFRQVYPEDAFRAIPRNSVNQTESFPKAV